MSFIETLYLQEQIKRLQEENKRLKSLLEYGGEDIQQTQIVKKQNRQNKNQIVTVDGQEEYNDYPKKYIEQTKDKFDLTKDKCASGKDILWDGLGPHPCDKKQPNKVYNQNINQTNDKLIGLDINYGIKMNDPKQGETSSIEDRPSNEKQYNERIKKLNYDEMIQRAKDVRNSLGLSSKSIKGQ